MGTEATLSVDPCVCELRILFMGTRESMVYAGRGGSLSPQEVEVMGAPLSPFSIEVSQLVIVVLARAVGAF